MKIFADFDRYKIYRGSCLDLLAASGSESFTTVVADWPFSKYKDLLKDVVHEAGRVLVPGGTFISVHYPDENFYVRRECEDEQFEIGDDVSLKMKVTCTINRKKLPRRNLNLI